MASKGLNLGPHMPKKVPGRSRKVGYPLSGTSNEAVWQFCLRDNNFAEHKSVIKEGCPSGVYNSCKPVIHFKHESCFV